MIKTILLSFAALLIAPTLTVSAEGTLNVGDKAPPLNVKQWVKGDAVTGFEQNKFYVVEFWATWCGPCKASIPHLTELQKAHPDVTFIGVSVWERDQSKVQPFVDKMGDKMVYHVAMDLIPDGEKTGKMASNWMEAAGEGGIPTAFIIEKSGKIAWIGHPMNMEEPLGQILAGKWDVAAAAKARADEKAMDKILEELGQKLQETMQAGDTKAALAAIDDAVRTSPKLEEKVGPTKVKILLDAKSYDDAYAYAGQLADKVLWNNADMLNYVAWMLVDPEAKLDKRDPKLALRIALRASSLKSDKDAAVLDTLATAYVLAGDNAKAIETQAKAVELVKGTPQEKQYQERLEQLKKGTGKTGS